jgi:hypothetical protein
VVNILDLYSGGTWFKFFGRDTGYIVEIFHNFPQASKEGAEIVHICDNNRFLSDPFQFISHLSIRQ